MSETWPPFLAAFRDQALAGHGGLLRELEDLHRTSKLAEHVVGRDVLELEHRNAVRELVEHCGESDAGRLFQDMLAYVLAMAGYRSVRVNPVGVPDIELGDPDNAAVGSGVAEPGSVQVRLSREQVKRLVRLTLAAGELEVADELRSALEKPR